MKDEILKLLPEIRKIKDKDLKEKVILTWEEGIKLGGWELDDLEKIPFTLLLPDNRINLIHHTRAVTSTALKIAQELLKFYSPQIKIDLDVILAGGILHDVGKLLEYKKEKGKFIKSERGKYLRHPFSGANLAYTIGIPGEVIHTIAAHSKEGDYGKRTIEGIIINHSDFINFEILGGKT